METTKTDDKAGGKERKSISCSHNKKPGHSHENCFILHPEKRPSSSATESAAVKALQAELAELKKKMSTMASLGQVVHS